MSASGCLLWISEKEDGCDGDLIIVELEEDDDEDGLTLALPKGPKGPLAAETLLQGSCCHQTIASSDRKFFRQQSKRS